jgi:hypothetical protein
MIQTVKDQWVKRLKSGKYKKARRFYRENDECYCATGLLLDILDPDGWYRVGRMWQHRITLYEGLGENDKLNGDFFPKTGLTWEDYYNITNLNDYSKMTLPEIGTWVEEHL